ncbi:MAG: DNA polymerase III subunit beta [Cyanobacteria bacterium QH_6_48_35]|jgi:DNA polymerase-3 subunit beta|nr:MAG: DNA polymerase III subunit beta [Cyanobacteria bacterium QH_1_48_107]PSO63544.1 MAG: DNA polymerase III subunit beta [Cyanobacteria bacterium QH_6_48_35]
MKLVCSQSDLSTNLSLVSRAVPSRPTHPVLGNVLLAGSEETQRVNLTAFDLSLGIQTSFAAQVEATQQVADTESSTLTLPAKLLNDIVSRLPEGEITLWWEADEAEEEGQGFSATLTSASGHYQFKGMSAQDFPDLPVIATGEEALTLPVEALSQGLGSTLFAVSTDETKLVLTGVHITQTDEALEFAGTDGHRLAVVQAQSENSELSNQNSELAVTIPARALRELERILGTRTHSDLVALRWDEGQVTFELGDQRLTSRKLEGDYPTYQQLIPSQFSRQMSVERRRLLSSLELVAVLADQKNSIVKFSLDSDNQQLSLSVDAPDVGSAKESMPAQITGESTDIAFNVKYLMDGLKALKANDIQMQLNSGTQPVIFTPLGGLKMTYLVMPVQLRS